MKHPTLEGIFEQARQEQWTRLAVLAPDAERANKLRESGWPAKSIVIAAEMADVLAVVASKMSEIGNLKELVFSHQNMGDLGACALAEQLPGLISLDLSHNKIGYEGARAIAARIPGLKSLNLARNSLDDAGARVLARELRGLVSLDLSWNRIGDAGAQALAEHLPKQDGPLGENGDRPAHLISLNLAGNEIGEVGVRSISAGLRGLASLDLSKNRVGDIGARVIAENLCNLIHLNLSKSRIGQAGARVIAENLRRLKELNLSGNSIGKAGARVLAEHLHELENLELSENLITDSGAAAIATFLSRLNSLDLSWNSLSDEGAAVIAEKLPHLTTLNLSGNVIHMSGAKALAENLTRIKVLDLAKNSVGKAGARLLAERLSNLTTLDLSENSIGADGALAIADHLHQLTSLKLPKNAINEAGASRIVHSLLKLRLLDLSDNMISVLPKELGALKELSVLRLRHTDLSELPRALQNLPELRVLDIRENPRLNLPPELGAQDCDAIGVLRWYFTHKRRLNEAKVLMVGQGGVGKTSMVAALIKGTTASPDEPKTEKIHIDTWTVAGRHRPETIRVNIWDFGGQEIMHATHQFFLTKRSVYVLVIDSRQGEVESNIHYWLQTIQSFGGDSPVLIVSNKCDVQPLSLNENGLRRQYESMVINFHAVSCKTLEGIGGMREKLTAMITGLVHLDDELPNAYFSVKAALEQMARDRHYFEMPEYTALCAERGVVNRMEQRRLLRFLHDLGTVLNFNDSESPYRVSDTNILHPEWVTEGVYAIINNQPLMQAQGRLELKLLPSILKDSERYPEDKQQFIVEMMRKFELCFAFPDDPSTLLVPELLSKNEPDINWKNDKECLNFRYTYGVLPGGLIPRFIVRMHHALTSKPTYWRSGVILAIDGCKAKISGDSRTNQVNISVDGKSETRRSVLATIRDQFRAIHATIPKLQVEERVPLPDNPKFTVSYDHLLELEEISRTSQGAHIFIPEEQKPGEKKQYSAHELLNGLDILDTQPASTVTGPAISLPSGKDGIQPGTDVLRIVGGFLLVLSGAVAAIVVELLLLKDFTTQVTAITATVIFLVLGFIFVGHLNGMIKGDMSEGLIRAILKMLSPFGPGKAASDERPKSDAVNPEEK